MLEQSGHVRAMTLIDPLSCQGPWARWTCCEPSCLCGASLQAAMKTDPWSFFVGLCWKFSSVSINLHPLTVEDLSVDLFIREQHRPSLSTVTCWGVDENTCILRRPSVKLLFGCTMLHITPCLCTYIHYIHHLSRSICSFAVTSSPTFLWRRSTIICRSMLWGHLNVSLVEIGSLQVPLFWRSVSAFAGQLRKIQATCHVSKSVWFD